jgi:tellurite resistance protein
MSTRAYSVPTGSSALQGARALARVTIPPAFFGAALGLSGLSALWLFASKTMGAPRGVSDAVGVLAAVVWCVLAALYLRQGPRHILADALDTAAGPTLALPVMSALLLGSVLSAHAHVAGQVVVIVFLVVGTLFCGLLLGQWFTGGLERDKVGPAFYLPGGGFGFVGTEAAYQSDLHAIAPVFLGIGFCTWVLVSSAILNRLMYGPHLSPPLLPTMAIEIAPPTVGGTAYLILHPGHPDFVAYGFAGYAAIFLIAQVRLLPLYRQLSFSASFWTFTFPTAATATFALHWLTLEHPAGHKAYAWIVIALANALIAWIGLRTIAGIARWWNAPHAAPAEL